MSIVENLPPFTFLLLSDIHFGEHSDAPDFCCTREEGPSGSIKHRPLKDGIVATVKKLPDKPTAILAPGDLTSIASPDEFFGSINITKTIAQELAIDEKNIFITYGNHDTNWRICDLGNSTDRFKSAPRYSDIASRIGDLYTPKPNCMEAGPEAGSGVFTSGDNKIFILNSGLFCTSGQVYKHGRLGDAQLRWFEAAIRNKAYSNGWRILMVHHHPFNYTYPSPIEDVSCIEEGAEVVDLAGRYGIDIICHGHRHQPRLFTEMRNGWKSPITFFCAGSVAVKAHHRDNGLIPNVFHTVTLQKRLPSDAAFGKITTFEFTTEGWKQARYSTATPLDHVHWFGTPASQSESKRETITFLSIYLPGKPGDTALLPAYEMLPPALLCLSLDELNRVICNASMELGARTTGKYPDEIMLRKL